MDRAYHEASKRHGWGDSPNMRKRWKEFQEHRKRCRTRAAERHKLYMSNHSQWEKEISELPEQERNRQTALEKRKADLLGKLKR